MSSIVFAWELGANYGHLDADVAIATCLREQGHEVLFIVRELKVAAEILTPARFPFIAAPISLTAPKQPAISYAGILLEAGLGDPSTFIGLMSCWLNLFDLTRPDVIVIDHAPMALIAARARALPVVLVGAGFTIPPMVTPLPSIRPWENIEVAHLSQADHAAVEQINAFLSRYGNDRLNHVCDLFDGCPALLKTFSELDHYGPRDGGNYVGTLSCSSAGSVLDWNTGSTRRIFAYLRLSVPGIQALLMDLEESGAQVVCVIPEASVELQRHFESTNITLLTRPISLSPLLNNADLVVTYAGAGMIAASLLAGVPMLLVPQTVEQYLGALRVEKLGAGILAKMGRTYDTFARELQSLLDDCSYRHAAQRFAQKYVNYDADEATQRAAATIIKKVAHSR